MREYCNRRYKWDEGQFDLVDWKSVGRVQKKATTTKFCHSCKLMHGWLPVMHKRWHINGIRQCPGCSHHDQTIEHFFQCPHPMMKEQRREVITELRKKRRESKIPKSVVNLLINMLLHVFQGKDVFDASKYDGRQQAVIHSQQAIGFSLLPRGYISPQISWRLKP